MAQRRAHSASTARFARTAKLEREAQTSASSSEEEEEEVTQLVTRAVTRVKTLPNLLRPLARPFRRERLRTVSDHAEARGKATISGRYHRSPRRFEEDYEALVFVLGRGFAGEVRLARSLYTGREVALKRFKLSRLSWLARRQEPQQLWTEALASEVEISLSMDHPNVARVLDVYESERKVKIVMEYLSGGTLLDRLKERHVFPEADAAAATRQMLLALNYLHSQGVVHRDLKLTNFVYETAGGPLKLIDFGMATRCEANETMDRCCGTVGFKAPEVLRKCYTSQCDLWSLGVVVFRLTMGHVPFPGVTRDEVNACVRRGRYVIRSKQRWAKLSPAARDFVDGLLAVDPEQRLTAAQALQHPWLLVSCPPPAKLAAGDQWLLDALRRYARTPALERACYRCMARSLKAEECEEALRLFTALDSDQDGAVSRRELGEALEGAFRVPAAETGALFEALGARRSGAVSYSELLAATVCPRAALDEGALHEAFCHLDADGDGCVTAEDLRAVLGETFDGLPAEELLGQAGVACGGRLAFEDLSRHLRGNRARSAAAFAAGA